MLGIKGAGGTSALSSSNGHYPAFSTYLMYTWLWSPWNMASLKIAHISTNFKDTELKLTEKEGEVILKLVEIWPV